MLAIHRLDIFKIMSATLVFTGNIRHLALSEPTNIPPLNY